MPLAGRPLAGTPDLPLGLPGPGGQLCVCTAPPELPRDSTGLLLEGKPGELFGSFGTFYLFGLYTHLEKVRLEGTQPHPDGIRGLQG